MQNIRFCAIITRYEKNPHWFESSWGSNNKQLLLLQNTTKFCKYSSCFCCISRFRKSLCVNSVFAQTRLTEKYHTKISHDTSKK